MGTKRLYLSAAQAAPITNVNPDAGWEYTTELTRAKLIEAKEAGDALALGTQIGPWTPGQDAIDRQYVSPPINGAFTFLVTDTLRLQLATREFNNGDNTTSRLGIRVVSQDGTTVRGTLKVVANYGPATELLNNATLRNKTFADADALAALVCQDGDRIIVEIGYSDAAGATPEGQGRYGAPTGTADHANNETETTSLVPWVEFVTGNALTFKADLTAVGRSVDLRWDVRVVVGLSRQLLYNVRSVVTRSVQALWNLRAAVGAAADLRWNAKSLVSRSAELIWNISDLTPVGRSIQALWHDRATVGSSKAAVWNVRATVGRSIETRWNALVSVGRSVQALWSVRATVTTSKALRWHVGEVAGRSGDLRWRVGAVTGRSVDLRWNLRSRLSRSIDLRWNVLEGGLSAVGRSVALVWSLRAPVGRQVSLLWNGIASATTQTFTDRSAVRIDQGEASAVTDEPNSSVRIESGRSGVEL